MKKIISGLVLGYIAFQGVYANSHIRNIAEENLNKYFEGRNVAEHFSGVGLAIGLKGEPIQDFYTGTVGLNSGKPVNKNSLFQIGSISKSFTAARVLQLVKKGKLSLDDKISDHLKNYPKWGDATIRQLLDMSSGLPNYSESPT
ncbi:beta-lactamase family protein, partial [Francisellaceae bacterium]|nr:beta-lactamase family protein [Francisellaceae bacterium]